MQGLGLKLTNQMPWMKMNEVMLGLGKHKHSLTYLAPSKRFTFTAADIADFIGKPEHVSKVREWDSATWEDWSDNHAYIQSWTEEWLYP